MLISCDQLLQRLSQLGWPAGGVTTNPGKIQNDDILLFLVLSYYLLHNLSESTIQSTKNLLTAAARGFQFSLYPPENQGSAEGRTKAQEPPCAVQMKFDVIILVFDDRHLLKEVL